MAKKETKKPQAATGENDWLTTYCDCMTLLFTFFVLLFAISQVDVQKFNLLAASLNNRGATPEQIMELGLQDPDDFDMDDPHIAASVGDPDEDPTLQDIYDMISAHIANNQMDDKVSAYLGDDYIFIRFVDDMLFEPNSARIRQQDYELLRFIGRSLRTVQDGVGMIRIDGHTASVPDQENYHVSDRDLSGERANAVLKYFEDYVGIDGDKLSALAFGRFRPIADNDTEEGRRQNRRIEIMVTESNAIISQLDNIYEKIIDGP